jgi:cyanophycinase
VFTGACATSSPPETAAPAADPAQPTDARAAQNSDALDPGRSAGVEGDRVATPTISGMPDAPLPADTPEELLGRWWAQPDDPYHTFEGPVAPDAGWLFLAGGGALPADVMRRFVELAGGPDARIVVIPTASGEERLGPSWNGLSALRRAGARNLELVHTRSRREANSPEFASRLDAADAVWIPGGRPYRVIDAYLGTLTHDAIARVLERGGVVGGSSAGASILASYLVRGAPEGNHIVMGQGYERGFGFVRRLAVDQHLRARGRVNDLTEVVRRYPYLLGLGLDEGTAVEIRANQARVLGAGRVYVYESADYSGLRPPYFYLLPGDRYDLLGKRVLR